ncbi:MAG TPA: ubiquinol-cytochrome c reductase iron-sulfur subunit [Nodosilinea sp.]|nr:ubiquinol-cytochrome c reductase iron-sulfur subunit [Nodosilinea sp.]
MHRRDFTNLLGLGLLAGSLPVALAACRSGSAPSTGTGEFVPLGTVADLDAQGALANADLQGQNVAVVRDPSAPATLLAVSAVCTHAGCTVAWDQAQALFACPCHGGRFNPDGSVNSGPPPRGLTALAAKIEGDQVLVQL